MLKSFSYGYLQPNNPSFSIYIMKIQAFVIYLAAFMVLVACGSTKGTSTTSSDTSSTTSTTSSNPGGGDDDYDGVANKDDECPYIYGSARTGGCPDTDGDGIRDSEDLCPDDKGFANLKGCRDRDYDGVIDPEDKCPDEYGEGSTGCATADDSDIDGDGVKNEVDECPDVFGWFTANGCPDADGDGIKDDLDECPNMWGTPEHNGCALPKSDVIALLNKYGDPNKTAGVADKGYYQGVDGKLYDKNDKIINVVGGEIVGADGSIMTNTADYFIDSEGSIRNQEGKLVQLDEDNYLFIRGVGPLSEQPINSAGGGGIQIGNQNNGGININNNSGNVTFGGNNSSYTSGNPYSNGNNSNIYNNPQNMQPLTPEEAANCNRIDLASLRAAIYFDYDAAQAESTSLQQLNRIVDAMQKCAALELQVAGYADSDGSHAYNDKLSERRAKSILRYITGQGVSDQRLKFNAYGERYPVAPNTSDEGKQLNRRAEISVTRTR